MRYRHKRLTKYDEYEFEMIKKSKRYFSKCLICGKILSNSCLKQLMAHRVKCISKRSPPERRDTRRGVTRACNNNFSVPRTVIEPEVKLEDGIHSFDYPASLVETKYDSLSSDDDGDESSTEEVDEVNNKKVLNSFNQNAADLEQLLCQDTKILENNLENLQNTKCRGCFTYKVNILFSEAIEFYSEETHRNENITYLSMFHECTSIKINPELDNSEGLCNYCAEELTIAYSFRRKCLYANYQYMLLVNDDNTTISMPPQQERNSTSQESSMQSSSSNSNPIAAIIEIDDDDDIVEITSTLPSDPLSQQPSTTAKVEGTINNYRQHRQSSFLNKTTATRLSKSNSLKKSSATSATPPEYIDINYENLNCDSLIFPAKQHQRMDNTTSKMRMDFHKSNLERRIKMELHQRTPITKEPSVCSSSSSTGYRNERRYK